MIGAGKLKGGAIVLLLIATLAVFDAYNNDSGSQAGQFTGAAVLKSGGVSSKECRVNLADYPCQFVKKGKLDALMVIGDRAGSYDTAAAATVALGLKLGDRITASSPTFASKVADPFANNIISVGSGCSNAVTYRIQSRFGDVNVKQCWNRALTKEGEGAITLYDFGNGKFGLVVEGYTGADEKNAAKVLQGYKDWQAAGLLKGKTILVLPSSSGGIRISGQFINKSVS